MLGGVVYRIFIACANPVSICPALGMSKHILYFCFFTFLLPSTSLCVSIFCCIAPCLFNTLLHFSIFVPSSQALQQPGPPAENPLLASACGTPDSAVARKQSASHVFRCTASHLFPGMYFFTPYSSSCFWSHACRCGT